ncbi:hypothetical protein N431DRAFT_342308 [Stipitochalara longipes BDJ]|nr:hypothetical protein N431DRAFT_342308 [Stipitochalara longipes BDJ]
MPASSVILLFSVALGVSNALPWAGPQPTNAYEPDAWSPVPTGTPADPAKLFKRTSVDVNVCGWLGGDVASPAACASGSSCVHDTIYGYVGCCATAGPCTDGVYTSCVDGQSSGNLGTGNNGVYTCPGTSVCYQNTYPGGYLQYSCGSSGQATSVLTSYNGQPSNMFLQVVYTSIDFTAAAAPTITPTVNPTSNVSPSTSATGAPSHKESVGAITGFTIAGLGFLVALLAFAFVLWRRRRSTHGYRAGPFVSHHTSSMGQPPTSGPFQRIGNSSYDTPDDFMKHRSGITTTVTTGASIDPPHPGTLVFPDTLAYAGAADPHHPYTSAPSTPYFPPDRQSHDYQDRGQDIGDGEREETPLVSSGGGRSEIEDFSRGFHDAMAERLQDEEFGRDTRVHSGIMPGGIGGTGIGMGLGLGNYRTEDREARSEAFRERVVSMGMSPPLGSHPVRGFSYDVVDVNRREQGEEEFGGPPTELRASGLLSGLGSAVGRRTPEDERPRYQLDEVVGEHVPILHGAGQMAHQRQKSLDES